MMSNIITIQQVASALMPACRDTVSSWQKSTKQRIMSLLLILIIALPVMWLVSEGVPEKSPSSEYKRFVQEYAKRYEGEQEQYRHFLFFQTYDHLIFQNQELDQKYTQVINEFADLSPQEFKEMFLIVTEIAKEKSYQEIGLFNDDYIYDWTKLITPVKNLKGHYSMSHIFAVTAALEFKLHLKQISDAGNKNAMALISLSEQEIIDCCPECRKRMNPSVVYSYLQLEGVSSDQHYPYVNSVFNVTPGHCKTNATQRPFQISGKTHLPNKCSALTDQIKNGPIVVGVDATNWRNYGGGIFSNCEAQEKNHYALLVGKGLGYWKIKNSWGRKWGEKGYIRIKSGNTCGVCVKASNPIL